MGPNSWPSKSYAEANIRHIEIYYYWVGFANPSDRVAKWTLELKPEGWERVDALTSKVEPIAEDAIDALETAIALPVVPALDLEQFEPGTRPYVEFHYGCFWTDDLPMMLLKLNGTESAPIVLKSASQHGLMLPWEIERSGKKVSTFNIAVPVAIRRLLPEQSDANRRLQIDTYVEYAKKQMERINAPRTEIAKRPKRNERPKMELLNESLLCSRTIDRAKELLADGANPLVEDEHCEGLLHKAVHSFSCDFIQFAATQVKEIDKARFDGLTPLQLAAAGGMSDGVRTLIEVGANVNCALPDGTTSLMLAKGRPDMVETLIKAGADVSATDKNGNCALHYALDESTLLHPPEIGMGVQHLLAAGGRLDMRNKEGMSPLDIARRRTRAAEIVCEVRPHFFGKEDWPASRVQEWKALLDYLESA